MSARACAAIAALVLGALGACTPQRDPSSLYAPLTDRVVVEATLVVGSSMPPVRVSRTFSPALSPDSVEAGIEGADVLVIGPSGPTTFYDAGGGLYRPQRVDPVLAGARYRLHVVTPDGRLVTAETVTPDTLRVREWVLVDATGTTVLRRLATFDEIGDSVFAVASNRLTYGSGLVEARFDPGDAPGYQLALFSRSPGSPLVIDPDFIDDADLADLPRAAASPALEAPDGRIRVPWLAVWYEGRYVVRVFRVDRNWFDLLRSEPGLFAGSTTFGFGGNVGDQFDQPIFHVEGGIGLFASASVDSVGVVIEPRPATGP